MTRPDPADGSSELEIFNLLASRKIYQYTEKDIQNLAEAESASFESNSTGWMAFGVMLVFALYIDFKYGGDGNGTASFKTAMLWTVAWVCLAQVFAVGIYSGYGYDHTILFQASYLLEKSLSLDNVFVFLMLFKTMQTPRHLQPKILNWGILLALVFRAMFIVAGTLLLHLFAWLMPLLGLFLLWTGLKLLVFGEEDDDHDPMENPMIKALQVSTLRE
jgi:tellurite resistance protein TerC